MVREGPAQQAPPLKSAYAAADVRSGEIILNTPLRRALFVIGLAGAVALALVLALTG